MDNTVVLQINEYNNNIYKYITEFLDTVGINSGDTRTTYESAIRDFFKNTRNKEIEYLTIDDLNFDYYEVEKYRNGLMDKYKASTINVKITAVRRMFNKLERYGLKVNDKAFDVDKLKEYDTESYGIMSLEEVNQAIEIVKNTNRGDEKELLIKIAFATAFRKSVLLNLRFDDFYSVNGQFYVRTLGKGKKWSVKRLNSKVYHEVLNKQKMTAGDKLFSLSSSAVQRMMDLINKEMDFGKRKITFHSLKKASIEEVGIRTNFDIKAMQKQGDHSDVSTTLNIYVAEKDIEKMPTISTEVEKIDFSQAYDLTKDEIFDIIKKLGRETQNKFITLAKEQQK